MKIEINNKIIVSKGISSYEFAWAMLDAFDVLDYYYSKKWIVLGGDILTSDLRHNYDSWYYNINANKDESFNLNSSVYKAKEYIAKYIENNGVNYYIVFVTE